jgi:hypothetical protein
MTPAVCSRLTALAVALSACGPRVVDEPNSSDLFDELEQSVDAFCDHVDECEQWLNDQGYLADYKLEFTKGDCYGSLHASTQRIAESDRCTDPQTVLMLLDCVTAVECRSIRKQDELCEAKYLAVEDALCNPF